MRDSHLRTLGLLCALSLMAHDRGHAQDQRLPAWRVIAGATAHQFKGDKRWAFGPSLGLRRMVSHRVSLDLDVSDLLTNSGPDKFKSGVFGNFGPSLVWRSPRHDFAVSMGISAGTLWEENGGQASTFGIFGGVGGTYWLGTLGLSGRAAYHIWYGDPGATFLAGVALRF